MADQKLTELTEALSIAASDLLYMVADPAGSPTDKKITLTNLLASVVLKSLFNANSIVIANSDDTPEALEVAASRIVGRGASGGIDDLTGAQIRTILGNAPFVLGSDADGDMWYRASGALARLAKGTAYKHLGMNSGATAPEWQDSAKSVLTAGGDLLYASAANTLARLAKGTANHKLFMNAGATAPEWAAGIYCITTTRYADASTGNIAVTGVGFKPSAVIAFVQISNTESISLGMYFGGNGAAFGYLSGAGWQNGAGALILMYPAGGGYTYASVSSWDSDGMTLNWVSSTSPAPGHEEMKITYAFLR